MTSEERTKSFITFLSLCGELGKECTRFALHRWYRHYLRSYFLTQLLPIHANSCFLFTSCSHSRAFNHSYYYVFRIKGRAFEANKTFVFQNML